MRPDIRRLALLVALALLALSRPARSQGTDCPYERCALRVQYGTFAPPRIVQGSAGTRVATLGFFAPQVPPLGIASDTVRFHFEAFRSSWNRGSVFNVLGGLLVVAGLVYYSADRIDNETPALVLSLVGAGFSFVGTLEHNRAREHLSTALWLYNGSLATRAP